MDAFLKRISQQLGRGRPLAAATAALPLDELLPGSLFYPASGLQGDPVRHLSGMVQSFVYADWGVAIDEVRRELRERGFLHYNVSIALEGRIEAFGVRHEQAPGVVPKREALGFFQHAYGVKPKQPRSVVPGAEQDYGRFVWAIAERQRGAPAHVGPERFSWLFVVAEGVTCFEKLYAARGIAPEILVIVQLGTAFGGNRTDFTDPQGSLAVAVRGNRDGMPRYLVTGGLGGAALYAQPCWPEYAPEPRRAWRNDPAAGERIWTARLWELKQPVQAP
jgi:hypothetical protein